MMLSGAQSTSPEVLHCLSAVPENAAAMKGGGGVEMSVLERQRAVLKWQQDQLQMPQFSQHSQQQSYFNDLTVLSSLQEQGFQGGLLLGAGDTVLSELVTTRPMKMDPGLDPGRGTWPEYGVAASTTTAAMDYSGVDQSVGQGNSTGFGHGVVNYGISRTASCPPVAGADKLGMAVGKESFKKRKADNKTFQPPKAGPVDESRAKKVKGCCEEEESAPKKPDQLNSNKNSNSSNSNSTKNANKESKVKEGSGGSSKENSKVSEVQKPDYIHVRARRGQATDSHSLAERVRREKISERMKYLQDLVPGCNKITGKAGMLDEIINYVQSLQRQVEFLSMKLAAVNPRLDFNIEDLFSKEVFPACSSNFPAIGVSSEMANLAYLQFNPGQQMVPVCGSELGMNEVEMGLRRTISAPVSIPDTILDSSCLSQQIQSCLPWDQSDLQSIFNMELQQARQQSFPSQTYTGAN